MPTIKNGWYEFIVSYKIGAYRNLLNLVVRQMEEDLANMAQEAENSASQLEDDETRNEYQEYLGELYLEREQHKSMFLHAFFASSFALFEHELVRICERAGRQANNPISVKDFGGRDYMENVKKYLKRLGLDFPAGSLEWNQATEYRIIRNKIMHEASELGENEKDNIKFATENGILVKNPFIHGTKEFVLQLTSDFCSKALRDFQRILLQIDSAYHQWLQDRKI